MGIISDAVNELDKALDERLGQKADVKHSHAISDIEGLQEALKAAGETPAPSTPSTVSAEDVDGLDEYVKERIPEPAGGIYTYPGVIPAGAMSGSNDTDRMKRAMTQASGLTYSPYIQLPDRVFDTGSTSFPLLGEHKIVGPGFPVGPKNLEQGTKKVAGVWKSSCGINEKSLFTITGNVYGVTLAGIAFQLGSTSQLMHTGTAGNLYSSELNSLTIYGGQHVLGSKTQKFLNTFTHLTGIWTVVALSGIGFHPGGSDSWFWANGAINLGAHQQSDGKGDPLIWFDGQSKSTAANMYVTADQNFRPIKVSGSGDITIRDSVFEGYKDGDPTNGNAVLVQGGIAKFRDIRIAYAMEKPLTPELGIFQVTGGDVVADGVVYDQGPTAQPTVPLFHISGGTLRARNAFGLSGYKPTARKTGGLLETDSTIAA